MVYLVGDEEVPQELHTGATLLPRQSPDAELRGALSRPASRGAEVTQETTLRSDAPSSSKHFQARVLLVEDNPVNLLVAQRLLSVLGLDLRYRDQRRSGPDAHARRPLRPGADGLPDAGAGRLQRRASLARDRECRIRWARICRSSR
jgi:hypothetical protein